MTFCKEWRERMSYTQEDAAEVLECTTRTIRNYDKKTPIIAQYAMLWLEHHDD